MNTVNSLSPRWHYEKNPIVGHNCAKSIDSPDNQSVLRNGIMSLEWADYVFGSSVLILGLFDTLQLKQ